MPSRDPQIPPATRRRTPQLTRHRTRRTAAPRQEHETVPDFLLEATPPPTRKSSKTRTPKDPAAKKTTGIFAPGNLLGVKITTENAGPIDQLNNRQRKNLARSLKQDQIRGVRYGGSRWKWWTVTGAIGLLALTSMGSFVAAAGKPTEQQVSDQIQAALTERGRSFPTGQAAMWATQVVRVWGTWDAETADARKVFIAPYLTAGMDEQAGWDGTGKQSVLFVATNPDVQVRDANYATVSATYQIDNGQWRCVAVPLYGYQPEGYDGAWAFALANNPAPIPCTPTTGSPEGLKTNAPTGTQNDPDIASTLAREFFPGFFSAWGASNTNTLQQYTGPDVTIMGLGSAVQTVPPPRITDTWIYIPKTGAVDGTTYQAYVTVSWMLTGSDASLTTIYRVDLRRQDGRWVVMSEPQAASQSPAAAGAGPAPIPAPPEGDAPEYPSEQPTTTPSPQEVDPSPLASTTPQTATEQPGD